LGCIRDAVRAGFDESSLEERNLNAENIVVEVRSGSAK
jgi:hypothetical protein